MRDYFLGSKNIPWWGIGFSIVAAETSALTIISVPAMAFGGNLSFLQIIIGYVIARILLAIILVPHYFKREIYSPYQLLEQSFGAGAPIGRIRRVVVPDGFRSGETAPEPVDAEVVCRPEQPVPAVNSRLDLLAVVPEADQAFLGHVLGVFGVTKNAASVVVDPILVIHHGRLELLRRHVFTLRTPGSREGCPKRNRFPFSGC